MGERTGSSEASINPQRMHLCVNRISIEEGRRLGPSLELSRALEATSLVVFAATPRDQDRFFWSPLHPKVNVKPALRGEMERLGDSFTFRSISFFSFMSKRGYHQCRA